MKLNFYPLALIVILCVANIFLFYRILNFDSKYDALNSKFEKILQNKQLSNSEIAIEKFKEDSYIRQQERDTNLLLFVFTLFATATAFITYRSFVAKVIDHTAATEQKYTNYETKSNEQHNIILELKSRIDLEAGHKYNSIANQDLEDGFYDKYLENKSIVLNTILTIIYSQQRIILI